MKLTVLLLTRDEEPSLRRLLAQLPPVLDRMTPDREILVLDAGSADQTRETAAAGGARVVVQAAPGFANALRQGLAEARGDWILTLDSDGSHPVEAALEMWRRKDGCDAVVGSRYLPGSGDSRTWLRRLMSRVLNGAYARLLGLGMTDFSGCFRLYRTEAVRGVAADGEGFEVLAVLLARLCAKGLRVVELPYGYIPRREGRSKARLLRYSWLYARTLLSLRRELRKG